MVLLIPPPSNMIQLDNNGRGPLVNWYKKDLDDHSSPVTMESLRSDYNLSESVSIYRSWIPLWLLSERLWEEVDGDEDGSTSYLDWSNYTPDGIYPPIKVDVSNSLNDSNSYHLTIHIRDGNHRIRYWKKQGLFWAPAWIFDAR